ncbi:MAG: hypothetical protein ACYC1C_05140 [Chloroflexota bacterium]
MNLEFSKRFNLGRLSHDEIEQLVASGRLDDVILDYLVLCGPATISDLKRALAPFARTAGDYTIAFLSEDELVEVGWGLSLDFGKAIGTLLGSKRAAVQPICPADVGDPELDLLPPVASLWRGPMSCLPTVRRQSVLLVPTLHQAING